MLQDQNQPDINSCDKITTLKIKNLSSLLIARLEKSLKSDV